MSSYCTISSNPIGAQSGIDYVETLTSINFLSTLYTYSITMLKTVNITYILVGGGGGGTINGGGGGGETCFGSFLLTSGQTYSITVGAGSTYDNLHAITPTNPGPGGNTTFSTIIALGGDGPYAGGGNGGGSGGGQGGYFSIVSNSYNNGGNGTSEGSYGWGGGGGAYPVGIPGTGYLGIYGGGGGKYDRSSVHVQNTGKGGDYNINRGYPGNSGIAILNFPLPPTNYICKNASGVYQDLSNIFLAGNSGIITGFKSNKQDVGSMFSPALSGGPYINFLTNFIDINGYDLKYVFAPLPPFTVRGQSSVYYSTNYTFVTFTNPATNTGTITFNTSNPVSVNYLIVGGGGSGGAGGDQNSPIYISFGGGGASGTILQGIVTVSPNTTCNISVGSGGVCNNPSTGNYTPNNGTASFLTYSTGTLTGGGGAYGKNGQFTQASSTPGGTNADGNGGNGYYANSPQLVYYNGSNASNYNTTYQNYIVDSYNLGTFGGGGGGGSQQSTPYTGEGSGGNGGYYTGTSTITYYTPDPGTNGGGGGGGSTSYISQQPYQLNQAGASGGNGVVILWFLTNIT